VASDKAFGRHLDLIRRQNQQQRDAGSKADDEKDARLLEPGKAIKRELSGAGSHTFQIRLSAGQFLKVIVEQQGIDVVARLIGPDGKQIIEFDSESRLRGPETVEHVAEAEGDYRLVVQPRQKAAPAGVYEIRIEELRAATENDRALQEARKLYKKAIDLRNAGKYHEALPSFEGALVIQEKRLGPDHSDVGQTIKDLAALYYNKGEYSKAEPLFQRALAIKEKSLGPEHPDVAASLNGLAVIYNRMGDYAKAEPLYQRALAIREKSLGPEHLDVAASLNNLALHYMNLGDYAKAEPLFQRALAIREKSLGPENRGVASSLYNLALLYMNLGDYAKSESLHRRALAIQEKSLGPEHLDVAASLNHLAIIYRKIGDYAKSESLHRRALAIREKSLGPEHPDVTISLNNLANLYEDLDDYAKAEPLYLRALAIQEKSLGPDHPEVALSLNNLAIIYSDLGDYAKAKPLFQRALAIQEKSLGPEHHDVAASNNNLANLYEDLGDYAKAEPLYLRALAIWEKALGLDHPEVANSLNSLANLYFYRGDYVKAESFYQRALAVLEKALGPEHPLVARTINSLAVFYRDKREYEKAEPLFQRALAIMEKALGPDHRYIAQFISDMAILYAAKGDFAQAVTVQARANSVGERNLARYLGAGSERRKLAYLALFSKDTDFTLSLHSQTLPHDPQALDLAFTTLLRRKGRGLDAMADTIGALRRRAAPEDQALFDQLAETRSQLAALTLKVSGPDKPETYRARLKSLEDKVEDLESALSVRSAELRTQTQPVTLAAVQAKLPESSALIEFAVCTPRGPQIGKGKPPRYIAYLLVAHGRPKWVDLGEAAIIDRAVDDWRKALRDPNRTDVKRLARAVDEKVMRPVRSVLGGMPGETRRLLIATDGSLNLIPFAALVDEQNGYLVRRYAISYLTSGRDLLRLQVSLPSKNAPLVVANPTFSRDETVAAPGGQDSGNLQAGDQVWGQIDPTEVFFQSLPGTEHEAEAIKAMLPGASMLLREQATETALKQSRAPSVLHIATHGFFLGDQEAPSVETRGVPDGDPLRIPAALSKWAANVENPLLRSGLALAGANERRSGDDDGVLTSMEAASLDLWGTKLVVLSACNTGLGVVRNGEGVYGLRRALVLAGSETQVMSLWPVLDQQTRGLMVGYYRRLMKGEGRGEALRQIQMEMLKDAKLRHPYYWASFIQAGEWANLDGRR